MLENLLRRSDEPIKPQQPEPHTGEYNLEKIDPKTAYIGAAQLLTDTTERWYACVMKWHEEEESDEMKWQVAARCNYGFDTPMEAKRDAAKQFPLIPVLSDDGTAYEYPEYGEDIRRKAERVNQAQARRDRKAERIKKSMAQNTPRAFNPVKPSKRGKKR